MIERGQKGTYHYPGGSSQAAMLKDRGAHHYDLRADDVPFSETQMVPLRPGQDGRWFEPENMAPPPQEVAALEPVRLVPTAPRAPMWPAFTALALSSVALGLEIVHLLGGK